MQNELAAGPKPKSKQRTEHRGVSIRPLPNGRWRVRWRLPGGKAQQKIVQGKRTIAEAFALHQVKQLRVLRTKRRQHSLAIDMGFTLEPATELQVTIEEECRAYYRQLVDEKKVGNTMQHAAEQAALLLLRYCAEHGLTHLHHLNMKTLSAWRTWLFAKRQDNGEPYKVSTINQWLKPVRGMLRIASTFDRIALGHDKLALALKHTPVVKESARTKHRIKLARALDAEEVHATLTAALAYDARDRTLEQGAQVVWASRPLAPDVAMLLLFGFRRAEYTYLDCTAVRSDAREGTWIDLPAMFAKGGTSREVYTRGFTVLGAELLTALVAGRTEGKRRAEWLSLWDYASLGRAVKRLRKLGAPADLTVHVLRATCATYQTAVAGMDSHRRVKRLGHGIQIAHDSYVKAPRGMVFGAPSLEDAMASRDVFERVLTALRAHPDQPRTEPRRRLRKANTQALLAKSPAVLRDALYPRGTARGTVPP